MSETTLFLRRLIRNPRQVSAIAPSSPFLARAMTRCLGPESRVVEFGPGTGSLTRGILSRGVRSENLACFELDPDFITRLRKAFPGITVHHAGADRAPEFVEPGVDAVISGLPLLSMPASLVKAIVGAAFAVLKPGGQFIQFTYGSKPPVPEAVMQNLGLTTRKGPYVAFNLPPARIYHFTRA